MYKVTQAFCSEKRGYPISLLVFHCFALTTRKMLSVFQKTGTSVHYLIQRNGKILSLVPENRVAYHAGLSMWRGFSEKINLHSIGIEIQNPKMGEVKYTAAQIKSLIILSKRLIKKYRIKSENIVGHSDIAPIRKPDPGRLFPWQELAQNGIGIYTNVSKDRSKKISEAKIKMLLDKIGYDTTDLNAALYAFTKRFLPNDIPIHPCVISQEAKVFQYWLGIPKSEISSKLQNAPCIYPKNAVKLRTDQKVLSALQQVANLYSNKRRTL